MDIKPPCFHYCLFFDFILAYLIFYLILIFLLASVFQVKQADELENILAKKFLRFLSMRAEAFQVLRRKPVQVIQEFHYVSCFFSLTMRVRLVVYLIGYFQPLVTFFQQFRHSARPMTISDYICWYFSNMLEYLLWIVLFQELQFHCKNILIVVPTVVREFSFISTSFDYMLLSTRIDYSFCYVSGVWHKLFDNKLSLWGDA